MINLELADNKSPDNIFKESKIGDIITDTNKMGAGEKKPSSFKQQLNNIDSNVRDVGDSTDQLYKHQRPHIVDNKSIIARAKNSVIQFPIYITSGIRSTEAFTISKAFEKVYATYFQSILSHYPVIDEYELNGIPFLKQFHTNLREAVDVFVNEYYEPIDHFDSLMKDSIFYSSQITENVSVQFQVVPTVDENLILENTRLLNEPLTGFTYLREAGDDKVTSNKYSAEHIGGKTANSKPPINVTINNTMPGRDDGIKNTGGHGRPVDPPHILRDSDVKKLNGMLPYTIEATFLVKSGKSGIQKEVKFIIGIKTVMHLISYRDLAEDLRGLITGNIKSLQKVRYKTGEISFKDYLFNTKGLKSDAAKHINYDKRWINSLKRLGEYDKLYGSFLSKPIRALTGGDVPIPNGTLVIKQAEVELLVDETGIDLTEVGNARRLAKTLFLIGIVIVDPTAGTMKVLFPDSDVAWDVQSIGAIDAEVSRTDQSRLLTDLNKVFNTR